MQVRTIVAGTATALALVVLGPPMLQLAAHDPGRDLQGVTADRLDATEVRFTNDHDDLTLAGQLFRPDTPGPHPAVALINGSGTSVRSNRWYLTVSDHLVDAGIAVLWPDKRGSGESEGDWRTAGFDALARDASASVDHLMSRDHVDAHRVGVIGMSQGGRVAALVAADRDDLAFAVNLSGGVLPTHASLRYEEAHNLRQLGFLPVVADLLAPLSTWAIINVRQDRFWEAVGNVDPLPHWSRTTIPVLFMFGTADTNVDTTASVRRLASLQQPNLRIETYDGSGHTLEQPPGEGDALIRPEALEDLTDFIRACSDGRCRSPRPDPR